MYYKKALCAQQENVDQGTLQITVHSKTDNRPVENALVRISYTGDPNSVIEEVRTDSSGNTPVLQLKTPPLEYSLNASEEAQPYAEYSMQIKAEDFHQEEIAGTEVLPAVLAKQPVLLNPRQGTVSENRIVIPPHTLFYEYPPKIQESEIKPVHETGEIVLSKVVIPEYIVVHDGPVGDNSASNYYVRYRDYIKNVAEYVKTPDGMVSASQMLEQFLFPSSMQYTLIGKLSGGEKRRLCLLHILMGAPNVLLLDEPTNDLDIRTLTILEDYLDHFQGIVIAVSHDRYFLDRVVRRIFAFEGDGAVKQYEGGYTDYQAALEERGQGQEESTAAKAGAEDQSQPNRKNWKEGQPRETKLKFTYKEQREWETIEETIAALEEEVAELEGGILQAASDYSRLNRLMQEKEEKEAQLEEKMERWMYLNELAEQIGAQ